MSRTTWKQDMGKIIYDGMRAVSEDTPLKERIKLVDALNPRCPTSWGKKSWQAARREYLVRFGYVPRTKAAKQQAGTIDAPALPLFDAVGEQKDG